MPKEIKLEGDHPLLNFHMGYPIVMPSPLHALDESMFTYKSSEHYFHCCKCFYVDPEERTLEEAHDWVAQADTAWEAKTRGRTLPLVSVPLWNHASVGHMLAGLIGKFTQHNDLQRMLLKTGDAYLIEHRRDPIWGDNKDGTGNNFLGKLLMVVRDQVLS